MKKEKKPPYLPANPEAVAHSIVCSQCAAKLKTIQQDFSFTVMVDRESILLYASDMLRITVDDNYCVVETLMPKHGPEVIKYRVRSTLMQWTFLTEYGLEQVSRNTILNLMHVYRLERSMLYTYFLERGVEVTNSFGGMVSEKLKFWRGIEHTFSN